MTTTTARREQASVLGRDEFAMSLPEIAAAMGCSRQAVDQLVKKALGRARRIARARGLEADWIAALKHLDQTGPGAAAPSINTTRR